MFLKFLIEFLAICLLLYGYLNEERVITWERRKARQIRRLVAFWRPKIKFTTLKHINKKRGTWDGYYVLMNDDGFRFIENSPLAVQNCKGSPNLIDLLLWALCDFLDVDYIKLRAKIRRWRHRKKAGHV